MKVLLWVKDSDLNQFPANSFLYTLFTFNPFSSCCSSLFYIYSFFILFNTPTR